MKVAISTQDISNGFEFELPDAVIKEIAEFFGMPESKIISSFNLDSFRCDQKVIEIIEKYNPNEDGIKIIEIPDNIEWYIEDVNGFEMIVEKHRTWS